MSQVLFSSATTPQLTDLDANFTELYALRNLFTVTGNTIGYGGSPSAWASSWRPIDFLGTCPVSIAGHDNLGRFSCNAFLNTSSVDTYTGTASGGAALYTIAAGTNSVAHTWSVAGPGTAGGAITWVTALKVDASANLLVGMSSAAVGQSGVWLAPASASNVQIMHASGSASATAYCGFYYNAGGIGSITQSGTTAVLYNTTSDQRLKDNITDAGDAGPVIDAVKVRQFDWTSDGSHQRFGFIAQELVTVVPEAVYSPTDPDEMMAVDYSKLVPFLVKEVQALRARLAAHGI